MIEVNIITNAHGVMRTTRDWIESLYPNKNPETIRLIARRIRKGSKLRAPRWKGELARGIDFKITKEGFDIINRVPYAAEQEEGYGLPEKKIVTNRMRQWAADKGYWTAYHVDTWYVRKFKPHIAPTIIANENWLLKQYANRGIENFNRIVKRGGIRI